jgi:hypothetical protein
MKLLLTITLLGSFKREEFKTLQQGCSTALVAALDPSITGAQWNKRPGESSEESGLTSRTASSICFATYLDDTLSSIFKSCKLSYERCNLGIG